jgi:hypothetical protein
VIDRGQQYYERRRQERRLKPGDRVAVAGWGVAIVIDADSRQVRAVVGNRNPLCVERKRVEWNEHNLRWEIPSAAIRELESRDVESLSWQSRHAVAAPLPAKPGRPVPRPLRSNFVQSGCTRLTLCNRIAQGKRGDQPGGCRCSRSLLIPGCKYLLNQ